MTGNRLFCKLYSIPTTITTAARITSTTTTTTYYGALPVVKIKQDNEF